MSTSAITPRDYVAVTAHALRNFRQRSQVAQDKPRDRHHAMLVWAGHNGCRVGAQAGRDWIIHPTGSDMEDIVLILRPTGRQSQAGGQVFVVKTVLTVDQINANMQSQNMRHRA